MVELNKLYIEDCLKTMSKMEDKTIDLVVTSPPYDDLRTYNKHLSGNKTEFNGIHSHLKTSLKNYIV